MPAAFCHCFRPSFGLCFTVDLRCDLENIKIRRTTSNRYMKYRSISEYTQYNL